jgi:hypothetical protein
MALIDKINLAGAWTASSARFANTTGVMIASAVDGANGESLADVYTLNLSAVAGGTGTVTVETSSVNNPYKGRIVANVPLNNATVINNVVPGINLVFATTGVNGDVSTVSVGSYLGTFDSSGAQAGVPSAGVRHQVQNTGTASVAAAKARLLTMALKYEKTGNVFLYIRKFAVGATEKVTGNRTMPYALTISGIAGAGATKTANLSVDGVLLGAGTILDLTSNTAVSGTGLKAVSPSYPYRVTSGPLTGLEFALDASCVDADAANVLIFPSRYLQIAPDAAGVEGAYGIVDVVLTETGQAAGVITTNGVSYYWARVLVPSMSPSESNPYPAVVALEATESAAAGWGV